MQWPVKDEDSDPSPPVQEPPKEIRPEETDDEFDKAFCMYISELISRYVSSEKFRFTNLRN